MIYNSDKLKLDPTLLSDNVLPVPLPLSTLTKPFGKVQPVMQNTVALGALMFLADFDFEGMRAVPGVIKWRTVEPAVTNAGRSFSSYGKWYAAGKKNIRFSRTFSQRARVAVYELWITFIWTRTKAARRRV